jgi:phospholipase C
MARYGRGQVPGISRGPRSRFASATRWFGVAIVVLVLASPFHLAAGSVPSPGSSTGPNATRDSVPQNSSPIRHVVVIMKENHAYDNLYGTYCPVTGPFCNDTGNGIPAGTCVPMHPTNLSAGCVTPFNLTKYQMIGGYLPHLWSSSHAAWNNGSMNGYWAAEGSRNLTFGHYNGSTTPFYWDLAEEYATGDNFFSSTLSYSLPNHWYLMAASSPSAMEYYYGAHLAHTHLHAYLNQANQTPSIQDLLANHPGVSWNYYDWSLPPYQSAINQWIGGTDSAYDLWNPLAAQHQSYSTGNASHFVNRSQFFSDAVHGALPNISWLIPPYNDSDHPGANLVTGSAWTASVLDAIEASPDWNSTAVFLTWDEYGGWYDHVDPPSFGSNWGYGFRVPLIVISPYAKENQIVHDFGSFDSILQFMEWRWGLGCLNALDCNSSRLGTFFDFHQAPRAPIYFSTSMRNTRYPMLLQSPLKGVGSPSTSGFDPTGWEAVYHADADPWSPSSD